MTAVGGRNNGTEKRMLQELTSYNNSRPRQLRKWLVWVQQKTTSWGGGGNKHNDSLSGSLETPRSTATCPQSPPPASQQLTKTLWFGLPSTCSATSLSHAQHHVIIISGWWYWWLIFNHKSPVSKHFTTLRVAHLAVIRPFVKSNVTFNEQFNENTSWAGSLHLSRQCKTETKL